MKNLRYKTLLVGMMLALIVGACSKDSPTEPTGPGTNTQTFDDVIAAAGIPQETAPRNDTVMVDTTIQDVVGGEDFFCRRVRVSAVETPSDFPLFDPNADLIWPGNLLQGASLDQATPDPIPVRRGPGTIVMVLDNGADSVGRVIPEVNLINVFNAKNQIIADNPGAIPARFSFSFEEVQSREQLALALDVSFSNLFTDVSAALSFSTDRSYNRFFVKLDQSFYTMAYQLPTSIEEIFGSSVTPGQLSQFVGPGNPATFISSVTYGRKFYLLIESTSSRTELDASVNASFGAAVAQGSLGASVKYVSDLENVRIKAYALGGESSDALSAITTDFESLKSFLAKGATINTGLPLSYVVRSLADPSKIVKTKAATEYDVVDCIPIGESIDNKIFWFRADVGVTQVGSAKLVTKWENFFGDTKFDALPPTRTYGGQWIANAVTGPNLPAVKFAPFTVSSQNDGALGYSGINFVGQEYTVWTIARLESQFANYPELFMYGEGTTQRSNLSIGYRNSKTLSVSNNQDTLNAATGTSVDAYKLYTIVFSKTKGLRVYINGSLSPAASDPTMTQALTSYLGARIGSRNGNPLYIAEIKAYGSAVTELQRQSIDRDLLIKYGL